MAHFKNISLRLCGVNAQVKVGFGYKWYAVELPCGVTVRVNPRAQVDGLEVGGMPHLVAIRAAQEAESFSPNTKLGKMVREWASSQCKEGKEWVAKNEAS